MISKATTRGRWPLGLALCAALWAAAASEAGATTLCSATMSALNFGDVDLVSVGSHTANATLNYSCTNDQSTPRYVRLCFHIGLTPRRMSNASGATLDFELYQGTTANVWGSYSNVDAPYSVVRMVPEQVGGVRGAMSGSYTLRGEIASSQAAVAPGVYSVSFAPNHTQLLYSVNSTEAAVPANCSSVNILGTRFPFDASANVLKSCLVSADPLDFGAVDGIPSSANIDATSTIRINCSGTTAYAVRLLPSSNDANGASEMKGQSVGNTSVVPYRLYSNAARSVAWGNLDSNDVEGSGNGTNQALTVYGRVPGLPNVRPDNYKDTVTVSVVY